MAECQVGQGLQGLQGIEESRKGSLLLTMLSSTQILSYNTICIYGKGKLNT